MKRLTLLFFTVSFSIFTFISKAQFNIYHPFPDSNAVWAEDSFNCSCGMGCGVEGNDFIVKGDTVVNGLTYHKVYKNGGFISWCGLSGGGYYYSYNFYGAYREDTSRHIYACCTPYLGSHDSLLYDFNLKIGDTLKQYDVHGPLVSYPFTVHSIDSVLVGGKYRKRFNLKAGIDSMIGSAPSIIEGIGSTQGLFDFLCAPFEIYSHLTCFSQNNVTVWPYPVTDSCTRYNLDVAAIRQPNNQVTVYPNPNNGKFTLEVKSEELRVKNTVEIYNILGEEIYSKQFSTFNSQLSIDLGIKSPGVYLYRVLTETGNLVSEGKFVVE
ncbi:MAG TPA: T9SS type A sorting domain-containing protein [Bacteroidia bacterium]|jgi:hypothetical protein|nr:T9SS type A sorting domain-containing protein [Bacteroidia bacterium]